MPPDGGGASAGSPGVALARAAGLAYVNDADPGIGRRRRGAGFSYPAPDGRTLTDPHALARIRSLAIPPAWTQVWICPDAQGHIQATGRDQRGRKQYRYHPDWRAHCDQTKYERMAAFGRALPAFRRQVEADLSRRGLPREKVLAAVARLLEITLIRVGNDEYARANKSFGLTTLRSRHARIEGSNLRFEFRGKSGVAHRTGVRDRRLARIVKACQDIPGQRLFQYLDADGVRHGVQSADINAYISMATGGPFTAKDFRTWAGSLSAAQALLLADEPASEAETRRIVAACVRQVAKRLGNTPAVCRSSYIPPRILGSFATGRLRRRWPAGSDPEAALLKFLETPHERDAAPG